MLLLRYVERIYPEKQGPYHIATHQILPGMELLSYCHWGLHLKWPLDCGIRTMVREAGILFRVAWLGGK